MFNFSFCCVCCSLLYCLCVTCSSVIYCFVFVLCLCVICVTCLLYFCTTAAGLKTNCRLTNIHMCVSRISKDKLPRNKRKVSHLRTGPVGARGSRGLAW
jgi:hypothetical protein